MLLGPCAFVLLWGAYCWRRAIPQHWLARGLIGLTLLIGFVELWNYGLLGIGFFLFVIAILLTTLLYGVPAGSACCSAVCSL